jgi:hypothetical protein
MFRYKSMTADCLVCRTWDGANEGGVDVLVAKDPKQRNSTQTTALLEDSMQVNYTYPYPDLAKRLATNGSTGTSEIQLVLPRYLSNDLIFASEPQGGTNSPAPLSGVTWQDLNASGRAWCRKYVQS